MESISVLQLLDNLDNYLDDVCKSSKPIIVSRKSSEGAVVLLSLADFNSLCESCFLLSTTANSMRLRVAIDQYRRNIR